MNIFSGSKKRRWDREQEMGPGIVFRWRDLPRSKKGIRGGPKPQRWSGSLTIHSSRPGERGEEWGGRDYKAASP